jgi:hypothetical protein
LSGLACLPAIPPAPPEPPCAKGVVDPIPICVAIAALLRLVPPPAAPPAPEPAAAAAEEVVRLVDALTSPPLAPLYALPALLKVLFFQLHHHYH